MPNGRFSDLKQKDWIKACKRLGLTVDVSRGKVSNYEKLTYFNFISN